MESKNIFNRADAEYNRGNFAKAFELFLEAANNGDDSAMGRVACMYGDGEGIEYNFDKSIYWDEKAANSGNLSSMFNLGVSYRTKGNIRQAKYWFEKSFESGDGDAALQLAKLYMVSEKETEKVVFYLKEALKDDDLDEESINEAKQILSEIDWP